MYFNCDACNKTYASARSLRNHHERQPLCARWLELRPGIKDFIDDKFTLPCNDTSDLTCGICGTEFSNVGNLNRHLDTQVICSKWLVYRDLKPLETYLAEDSWAPAPPTPCAPVPIHIIWNVFLTDREQARSCTEHLRDLRYVIAILPTGSDVPAFADGVRVDVLRYDGHDANVDSSGFDACCAKIEECRHERLNTLVFCNSGYQRSIPFLCHYLTRHHGNEVPTIERAIDLVLPQVDKANFASLRGPMIKSMEALLQE